MHNVPCRHVDFLRKTFQLFLEHHLKPLSQIHQSFIEDFLKNINELRDLADDFILCVIDVVGLYPDIPHKERLEAVRWTPFRRIPNYFDGQFNSFGRVSFEKQCF